MTYDIQAVRNLTTGRLHTKMEDIYTMLESITGVEGLMTTTLGPANDALKPYLKKVIKDERFWDGKHDTSHTGTIEVPSLTGKKKKKFDKRLLEEIDSFWKKVGKNKK